MSRDPIGYVDGLSLYGYVGSSPTGRLDPSGLGDIDTDGDGWPDIFIPDQPLLPEIIDIDNMSDSGPSILDILTGRWPQVDYPYVSAGRQMPTSADLGEVGVVCLTLWLAAGPKTVCGSRAEVVGARETARRQQWLRGRYSNPASGHGAYQRSGRRVFPTRRNSGLRGDATTGGATRVYGKAIEGGCRPRDDTWSGSRGRVRTALPAWRFRPLGRPRC